MGRGRSWLGYGCGCNGVINIEKRESECRRKEKVGDSIATFNSGRDSIEKVMADWMVQPS